MRAEDYDRFSVVAFASPAVQDAVAALRQRLPPPGVSMLAAHVTIKGTFIQPTDLAG